MKRISSTLILLSVMCTIFQGTLFSSPITVNADSSSGSSLQNQIDSDNQQIATLNQQIAKYQAQLNQAGADKKTLQAAIKNLDLQRSKVEAQIAATQSQINATQLQIQQLGSQIDEAQQNIIMNEDALAEYIRDIKQSDDQSLLLQLLSSNNLTDFWQKYDENVQAQDAVRTKTQELQTEEIQLVDNQNSMQQKKDALSAQNKSLASQQQTLISTVASKNQLLTQTNAKESTYQKLLAQAQAELNSFSNFTKNSGGAKLLANQTVCDKWGCYYNQRDTLWGASALNGTQYTLASDGCLVTSVAMVMTHYGYKNVTPATINSNPSNFAAYYPAYLLSTISVSGITATRTATAIDSTLANGTPVIIGMNVSGGTHFVVLVSGSNGSYIMRDPYIANGKDVNFSSHYSLREIYSIARVIIGS